MRFAVALLATLLVAGLSPSAGAAECHLERPYPGVVGGGAVGWTSAVVATGAAVLECHYGDVRDRLP